jgi:hypothetical protein
MGDARPTVKGLAAWRQGDPASEGLEGRSPDGACL